MTRWQEIGREFARESSLDELRKQLKALRANTRQWQRAIEAYRAMRRRLRRAA